MRLGFTGTRTVPDELVDDVKSFVSACARDYDEFTTGACVGFDALAAHHLLDTRLDAQQRLVVPANQSQVDASIVERFLHLMQIGYMNVVVEYMPQGSSYKQRNERIVFYSDALCAVVGHPEGAGKSRRSGSWQTVRIARRAGIEPMILTLSELTVPA